MGLVCSEQVVRDQRSRQLKVLHVIPSISERSGGPGQAIIPMCRALRDSGVDVLLATTDADLNGLLEPKLQTITTHQDVPIIFFKKQFGDSFKYSRSFAQWLQQHVSDFDVIHIHAVFNHACIAAARAARKQGVPYVIRPLGTLTPWALGQKSLRKKVFWHSGVEKMMRNAAAIHYTTRSEKNAVEESLGLNHGRVVPLGIDIQSTDSADDFRNLFKLQNHPYVLVLSRLLPTKGIDVLLHAFLSLVRGGFRDWRLVLAGDGPSDYVASLQKAVREQNATERVLFPGWISGGLKMSALQDASLLALPSHHENFGLCVMEALACGIPVLISPHVNLASEIEAAGAGWIASIEKSSVEHALLEACSSREELVRRGLLGKEFAAKFQWPVIAKEFVEVYREIAG
ncbi:MAG TPA: glycosyltransferase [Pyrinomonadaceae bacterium]|nr:glycosyltransferase [Pyrinomonadaceae bacterium]